MLLKRSNGDSSLSTMIVSLLAIVVFFVMIVLQLAATTALSRRNEITHICDSYLELTMAKGWLTEEDEQAMLRELDDAGCNTIVVEGYLESNCNQAAYGEKIHLRVTYSLDLTTHTFTSLAISGTGTNTVTSEYDRYTTCYK